MKRITAFAVSVLVLLTLLCGCTLSGKLATQYVRTLKNWMFQYNDGTNDYSVFFALFNDDGKNLDADIDVDIRIEDKNGNVLFKGTRSVTRDDYGDYSNAKFGSLHLAELRIPKSQIKEGTSSSGKVYLKLYKEDVIEFDEVNCDALYCLPVKGVKLVYETLPVELKMKDYRGNVESVIRIDEVSYSFDADISIDFDIYISGEKTQGGNKSFDHFIYKLYDSKGYMIDSGNVLLTSLSAGDKFKEEISIYKDVTPGETYTIKFEEYSY